MGWKLFSSLTSASSVLCGTVVSGVVCDAVICVLWYCGVLCVVWGHRRAVSVVRKNRKYTI